MKRHFPGLNGLRAIAASLVLIGHTYEEVGLHGNAWATKIHERFEIGFDMVNLFFVISGFIITYILLVEKNTEHKIDLKRFYIKRILRIWPIYFLIIGIVYFLCYFTNIYTEYGNLTLYSVFVLTIFAVPFNTFFHAPLQLLQHYWSLSVEEQFYLFWPIALKKVNILRFSVFLICFWVVLRNVVAYMASHKIGAHATDWNVILMRTKFSSMAIGAIGAYSIVDGWRWFKVINNRIFQTILWILFFGSVYFKIYIPYINYEVKASIYLMIILMVATSPKPVISLENKFLNLTGRISYGIYMYHWPLLLLVIGCLQRAGVYSYFQSYYALPVVALVYGINYLISYISFFYFERYFLRMKT